MNSYTDLMRLPSHIHIIEVLFGIALRSACILLVYLTRVTIYFHVMLFALQVNFYFAYSVEHPKWSQTTKTRNSSNYCTIHSRYMPIDISN